MHFLGAAGYRAKHADVTAAREAVEAGVKARGFRVLGASKLGIVRSCMTRTTAARYYGKCMSAAG